MLSLLDHTVGPLSVVTKLLLPFSFREILVVLVNPVQIQFFWHSLKLHNLVQLVYQKCIIHARVECSSVFLHQFCETENKHNDHKTRKERARSKDDKDETTRTSKASFTQNNNMKTCYGCGKKGHMSPKCPEKDNIPKEDLARCKAEQHMQAEQKKDDDDASQLSRSSKKTGWSGMQVCLMDKQKNISSKMKDNIILDNGSTLSIFANRELVEEI